MCPPDMDGRVVRSRAETGGVTLPSMALDRMILDTAEAS